MIQYTPELIWAQASANLPERMRSAFRRWVLLGNEV
jgi:hypothetical protein